MVQSEQIVRLIDAAAPHHIAFVGGVTAETLAEVAEARPRFWDGIAPSAPRSTATRELPTAAPTSSRPHPVDGVPLPPSPASLLNTPHRRRGRPLQKGQC
jgi:hypothetical protein